MDLTLFLVQCLNGFQLGTMLFLMASGLTLVFGIMNLINLAHGSLYMIGAYTCAIVQQHTGSFFIAVAVALPATAILGFCLEAVLFRRLYKRNHLDQVLVTFALILFFNEMTQIICGPAAYFMALPPVLAGSVEIFPNTPYPIYRLVIIGAGLGTALGLYLLIAKTRVGMLIRAGAENREMVGALGVNIRQLYMLVFGLGAALAGFAGMMAGPIMSVETGMGESILILALVVIVIGGIGSVRGAFVAAIITGLADTFGRVLLPPSLASMVIYILMALVLAKWPQGLFPSHA